MEPDAVEIRVLGCLVEKQRTTPDVYPLTLNALRLACNQSTNRDPVVEYDENTVRAGIERLVQRKWATLASWSNRRSMKYRHTLDGALGLDDEEISVLAVMMLRGPQTPGELKARTERLRRFPSMDELTAALERLMERGLVARLDRRPGQREERYAQLLGDAAADAEGAEPAPSRAVHPAPSRAVEPAASRTVESAASPAVEPDRVREPQPAADRDGLEQRVERLERELARVREELGSLREELGA